MYINIEQEQLNRDHSGAERNRHRRQNKQAWNPGIQEYYADSSISEQDVLYKLQFNLKLNKHGTRGQALNRIQEHYADNSTHKFEPLSSTHSKSKRQI